MEPTRDVKLKATTEIGEGSRPGHGSRSVERPDSDRESRKRASGTATVGPDTVVFITGGSAGVGRATARAFAERGAKVAIVARGKAGLDGASRDIEDRGGRALAVQADVGRFDQLEAAAVRAEQVFGNIDIWVNNAMVSMYSPFMQMSPEEFRHIVDVTFLGAVHGTRCALARMLPRDRGTIVQVGSALAFRSIPLQSAYCASKHAIQGLTESIRSELLHEKSNVRLTTVNMPALNTTQFRWTRNKMSHKARPAGTIFQPEVAADAILFAVEHDRRDIMVGYTTVEATLGEKIFPGLLDHYLAKAAWDGSLLEEPTDPKALDNFWSPVECDYGAHGEFDAMSRSFSVQLWATEHRRALAAGTLLLAGAGLAALMRSRGGSLREIWRGIASQ